MIDWPRMQVRIAILVCCLRLLHAQVPTGSISGVVKYPPEVQRSDARATLRLESAGSAAQITTEDTTYRFAGVTPGTYWLTAISDGLQPIRVKLDMLPGEQKELPVLPLRLAETWYRNNGRVPDLLPLLMTGTLRGGILGAVRLTEGAPPAANTQITLFCQAGPCGRTTTDSRGRFEFAGLRPGRYWMRMVLDGFYQEDSPKLDVDAGWEATHSFTLERCNRGDCETKPRPILITIE
jgi:hypothetical protein